jgi:hypothetical protein
MSPRPVSQPPVALGPRPIDRLIAILDIVDVTSSELS